MAVVSVNLATADGGSGGIRGVNMSKHFVYDPTAGKWVPSSASVGASSSSSSKNPEDVPPSSTGKEPSSKVDSKSEADKEYIETEFNTLVGELTVIPSAKNIKIKVNNTIMLSGVGSHLSGKYFVSSVKRTLSADSGYSQTLTVLKNGFYDSLKNKGADSDTVSTGSRTGSRSRIATVVTTKTVKVEVGDKVSVVGAASYITGERIPSWVKNMNNLTVQKVSSDGSKVLLSPISAWTYSRYVKKK